MKKKSYKITFSLQEGYKPGAKVHRINFAARIIKEWMTERLADKQPVVSGLLQAGTLFFPAKDTANGMVTVSPTAIFTGELSSPEDISRKNKEVKQTLESLAMVLKEGLKQESVFIVYRDTNWCV
ncbi:hypothetical protein GWR56_15365 [Mucilaginibacter sp. 14171R-50]|uniref:hypothetical protein n=1 Tax=Mucilaginibacter sp. 14171R-50 TaxID=2703789 RepID=UPI00138DB400|nr:hypothetical protein [Mucilaginibacter sp. 14171R-50]QHS56855.1 hypothetical protein GWR56_15365 [Mucilaginibacter sp. 14171R-50]